MMKKLVLFFFLSAAILPPAFATSEPPRDDSPAKTKEALAQPTTEAERATVRSLSGNIMSLDTELQIDHLIRAGITKRNTTFRWFNYCIWNAAELPFRGLPCKLTESSPKKIAELTKTFRPELDETFTTYMAMTHDLCKNFFVDSRDEEGKIKKPRTFSSLQVIEVITYNNLLRGLPSDIITLPETLEPFIELGTTIATVAEYIESGKIDPFFLAAYAFVRMVRSAVFTEKNTETALMIANLILMKNGYIPILCDRKRLEIVINDIMTSETQGDACDRTILYFAQEQIVIARNYRKEQTDCHDISHLMTNDEIRSTLYLAFIRLCNNKNYNPLLTEAGLVKFNSENPDYAYTPHA